MSNQFSNFSGIIKEFLKLDEEIRSLSKAKSDRTKRKEHLSKEIMNYYKLNNIHSLDLNFDGGKQQLELVESNRMPSVNQKFLRQALTKYCNNDKIVDNMIDHILEEREQNTSNSFKLKRIVPTSKKSKGSSVDAMELIKSSEKNKIQDRFNKLAEYAIAKDAIEPFKPFGKNDVPRKEDFSNTETKRESVKESVKVIKNEKEKEIIMNEKSTVKVIETSKPRTISIGKEVKEEEIEYNEEEDNEEEKYEDEDEDEEEVDLDNIPLEETGYIEPPPQLEEPMEKNKTIRNVISQRLDHNESEKDSGAIPKLQSQSSSHTSSHSSSKQTNNISQDSNILKELEINAVHAWKILNTYTGKYPILDQWIKMQNEKLKFIKSKSQMTPQYYQEMLNKIKTADSKYNLSQFTAEINKLRNNILNYLDYRLKN
jgi:hypothetical protein